MPNWILLSNKKEWSTYILDMVESQKFCWEKEARHNTTYLMIQEYVELIDGDNN